MLLDDSIIMMSKKYIYNDRQLVEHIKHHDCIQTKRRHGLSGFYLMLGDFAVVMTVQIQNRKYPDSCPVQGLSYLTVLSGAALQLDYSFKTLLYSFLYQS